MMGAKAVGDSFLLAICKERCRVHVSRISPLLIENLF